MDRLFYSELARKSLDGQELDDSACVRILSDASLEILPLLDAAFQVRKHYFGHQVRVNILNNAQNGHCRKIAIIAPRPNPLKPTLKNTA